MMDKAKMSPVLVGLLFGGIASSIFFVRAAILYSETPADPQKAVGYVFIAAYAVLIGVLACGATVSGVAALALRRRTSDRLACGLVAGVLMVSAVLLVVHSPK